jgi:predicted DCC family thiol-disulfide oxidoreductase YuxK
VLDTLLYDGDCGFCSSSARLAERLAPDVAVLPYQHCDLMAYDVTAEQCAEALRWVGTGGPEAGAGAVGRLLLAAGGGWRIAGRALLLPGVRRVADVVYRAVAANRYRLPGGTPACRVSSRNR